MFYALMSGMELYSIFHDQEMFGEHCDRSDTRLQHVGLYHLSHFLPSKSSAYHDKIEHLAIRLKYILMLCLIFKRQQKIALLPAVSFYKKLHFILKLHFY
jgi:hypothetical protein